MIRESQNLFKFTQTVNGRFGSGDLSSNPHNKITLPSYGSFVVSYKYNVHTNLSRHYMTALA